MKFILLNTRKEKNETVEKYVIYKGDDIFYPKLKLFKRNGKITFTWKDDDPMFLEFFISNKEALKTFTSERICFS